MLFVCTANICRSPMAAAILDALASDRGLTLSAESAGVAALVGKPLAPNARTALEEAGIYPGEHRGRQVSRAMLAEADLVLAMGPRHVAEIYRLFGSLPPETHTLLEFTDGVRDGGISDPYGHTISAYRASVRQLSGCLDRFFDRI